MQGAFVRWGTVTTQCADLTKYKVAQNAGFQSLNVHLHIWVLLHPLILMHGSWVSNSVVSTTSDNYVALVLMKDYLHIMYYDHPPTCSFKIKVKVMW